MSFEHIRVAVRVRPLNAAEQDTAERCGCAVAVPEGQPKVVVKAPDGQVKTFTYDHCFSSLDSSDPSSGNQQQVYAELGADLITSALDGYNSCLFAYGQTGAGKSHTMMGYGDTPGVIPRAVDDLFRHKEQLSISGGDELRIWASFVEIYNEQLRDLLDPVSLRNLLPGEVPSSLRVMDHPELGVILPGLVEAPCQTAGEVRRLIKFGLKKRVTSATFMNSTSSRSHAVFVLKVQRLIGRAEDGSQASTTARINLVDLAGSERHKSAVEGTTFREGCAINQSLSALSLVIKELGEQQAARLQRSRSQDTFNPGSASPTANQASLGKEVVPFRSSKLTFMLRDSLAGNSRSRMVAAISPAACNVEETLSTLRFASSVKKVKTVACQNVERKTGVVQQLQAEVRRLKALLAGRGVEVGALGTSEMQEEIADREQLLQQMRKSYELQLEEAALLQATRAEALREQGLSSADIDEVLGMEKNTPHLLNMSDDPVLTGCLMYFLPKDAITSVGRHPDNQIVLQGLGISEFLCQFENQDQRHVTISLPHEATSGSRVRINGKLLGRDETRTLQHFDRLIFGRASVMRLVIPLEQQELMTRAATDRLQDADARSGLLEQDMLKLLIPDESEAWSELRLYFGDLRQRLGEEKGNQFFEHLSEASHLVDEANEITTEIRPEDRLKFEVELVWDIHRQVSDIIVVRVLQWPEDGNEAAVLSYWTLGSFKQRLDMMRDCYDVFSRKGSWQGKGDPLEDPWLDPSTVELSLKMHASAEEQLQREDLRVALLGAGSAEDAAGRGAGHHGSTCSSAQRPAAGSGRRCRGTSPSPPPSSNIRLARAAECRSGGSVCSAASAASSATAAFQASSDCVDQALKSFRSSVPGSYGIGGTAGNDYIAGQGTAGSSIQRPAPAASKAQEGEPEGDNVDITASVLKQRLKDKEAVEQVYKDRIAALSQELEVLERDHGPLIQLLAGVSSNSAASGGCRPPPVLQTSVRSMGSEHSTFGRWQPASLGISTAPASTSAPTTASAACAAVPTNFVHGRRDTRPVPLGTSMVYKHASALQQIHAGA